MDIPAAPIANRGDAGTLAEWSQDMLKWCYSSSRFATATVCIGHSPIASLTLRRKHPERSCSTFVSMVTPKSNEWPLSDMTTLAPQ
ncbi:hypothetical protein GR250_41565 [Rhizobium leguminosarum]|nr:hypothetical protein [Rhizobium leguminosarum]